MRLPGLSASVPRNSPTGYNASSHASQAWSACGWVGEELSLRGARLLEDVQASGCSPQAPSQQAPRAWSLCCDASQGQAIVVQRRARAPRVNWLISIFRVHGQEIRRCGDTAVGSAQNDLRISLGQLSNFRFMTTQRLSLLMPSLVHRTERCV